MHLQEITFYDLENVTKCPLYHVTYAPAMFEAATV